MNHWKRGERLVEEINLAARNAHFHNGGYLRNIEDQKPRAARKDLLSEKEELEKCVKKCNSRLKQIQEDLKNE